MRVMIAEDEPAARRKLARLLTAEPDIAVVAAAENGTQAAALAESLRPEVSFLDIQMPGITGLDVAAQISSYSLVVFITAFSEHATRAFEINAVDYLLKPYTRERLQATLDRVRKRLRAELSTEPHIDSHSERRQRILSALAIIKRADIAPSPLAFLSTRDHGNAKPIALDSISWVEAEDNYCRLHFGNENSLQRITLTSFLERVAEVAAGAALDAAAGANAAKFVRIHRSSAVNIQHLAEITPLMSGDALLLLKSGEKIRLSRRYRQEFFNQLDGKFRSPQS